MTSILVVAAVVTGLAALAGRRADLSFEEGLPRATHAVVSLDLRALTELPGMRNRVVPTDDSRLAAACGFDPRPHLRTLEVVAFGPPDDPFDALGFVLTTDLDAAASAPCFEGLSRESGLETATIEGQPSVAVPHTSLRAARYGTSSAVFGDEASVRALLLARADALPRGLAPALHIDRASRPLVAAAFVLPDRWRAAVARLVSGALGVALADVARLVDGVVALTLDVRRAGDGLRGTIAIAVADARVGAALTSTLTDAASLAALGLGGMEARVTPRHEGLRVEVVVDGPPSLLESALRWIGR